MGSAPASATITFESLPWPSDVAEILLPVPHGSQRKHCLDDLAPQRRLVASQALKGSGVKVREPQETMRQPAGRVDAVLAGAIDCVIAVAKVARSIVGAVSRMPAQAGRDGRPQRPVDHVVQWLLLAFPVCRGGVLALAQDLRLDAQEVGFDRGRPPDAPQQR